MKLIGELPSTNNSGSGGIESINTTTLNGGGAAFNDASATIQEITNAATTVALIDLTSSTAGRKFIVICTSASSRKLTINRLGINRDIEPGNQVTFVYSGTDWIEIDNAVITTGGIFS